MDRATATNRAKDALKRLDDASFAAQKLLAFVTDDAGAIDITHARNMADAIRAAAEHAGQCLRDAARVSRQTAGKAHTQ